MIYLSAAVSAVHILAIALGLAGITLRARALGRGDVSAAIGADNLWGVAAVGLLGSGLLRAFGGLEKGAAFYLASPAFHLKLTLFGLIVLLELWPMITLVRWRIRPDLRNAALASRLARVSWIELGLMLTVPFVAAAMARGVGF